MSTPSAAPKCSTTSPRTSSRTSSRTSPRTPSTSQSALRSSRCIPSGDSSPACSASVQPLGLLHDQVTATSRGQSDRRGHDGLVLDRGQPAQPALPPTAVVGPLNPGHDRDPQLLPSDPLPAVQYVVLQQPEETLHGRVVPGRTDTTHRPHQTVSVQGVDKSPRSKLRSTIRM